MKIIDSDRDAAASLDRLTVLVERLKAQNAELQTMLTANEDRVRVLVKALRIAQAWVTGNDERTRAWAKRDNAMIAAALALAPPAETPVVRDASVDAPSEADVYEWLESQISRLRAELAAAREHIAVDEKLANEEIARLTRAADSARKDADAVRAEARRNADEDTNAWARAKLAEAAHAAITAKLGRAVDAIEVAKRDMPIWDCIPAVREALDAILADADGTQAAAAWRELQAAYASHNQRGEDGPCECDYCKAFAALAAVDARRGGGR